VSVARHLEQLPYRQPEIVPRYVGIAAHWQVVMPLLEGQVEYSRLRSYDFHSLNVPLQYPGCIVDTSLSTYFGTAVNPVGGRGFESMVADASVLNTLSTPPASIDVTT
jgi:hypothetical protein